MTHQDCRPCRVAAAASAIAAVPAHPIRRNCDIVAARYEIARDFASTISKCVARRDTPYPVFHGCVDWHPACTVSMP
jgi:hypothetical protein